MRKRQIIQQIVCLFSLCFLLSACTQAQAANEKETDLSDFETITPVLEVEDYRFVADGNGIVINWKVTNQEEIDQVGSRGADFPVANKNYLIRNVYKKRYPREATKDMKEDEYVYLDVYDLRTSNLEKKRIDLWEVSQSYLKDEDYKVYGAGDQGDLFQIGEYNYAMISVGKNKQFKKLLLNLDTGLVEGEAPESDPQITNREFLYLSTYIRDESQVLFDSNGSIKTDLYDGNINLKDVDPHAAVIFDQEDAEAYPLYDIVDNTIVNQEGLIATEELFMNRGLTFYDTAYLSMIATKDGEDHRITKFEDIATYAKKPEEYNNE